jgi:hypothetical protein
LRAALCSDGLEQNLLTTPIVEFRGPAVGVVSNPLSGFNSGVIYSHPE